MDCFYRSPCKSRPDLIEWDERFFGEFLTMGFLTAHAYLFAQIFGFAAMATAISMYQFKKHKTIMLLMVLCSSLWCIHYAFLGLLTPILMNVINVLRAVVFSQREKKWASGNYIPVLFILASVVTVIFTWDNAWSLLPCIASVSATVGNWQTDTQRLRALTIPVCVCWFIYNMINHSIAGMANETFTLVSVIVGLARYRKT